MTNLKILICEDNQAKAKNIRKYIDEYFEYGVDVDISYFKESALDDIEEKEYNLIFIDMNMKESLHGNYNSNAGLEILEKIEESYNHKYECVICTTISQIKVSISQAIQNKYTLLDYTYTNSDEDILKDDLTKIIKDTCKKLNIDINNKKYDIAIITALQEEMNEVRQAFNTSEKIISEKNKRDFYKWVDVKVKDDPTIYKATRVEKINGKYINIISASATKMGMSNTAVLATKMILKFKPKIIVMLGICAGKEGDIKLGDILIADRTFDYQAGKVKQVGDNKIFYPDSDIYQLDSSFLNKFEDKKEVWTNDILKQWEIYTGDKEKYPPTSKLGLVGSGAAVMAEDNTFIDIEKHNRKILGIDMEAYALFVAAEKTVATNKPKAILIKSVQDYANSKKDGEVTSSEQKDEYRKYGSFTSASFFINACHDYFIDYLEQE